MPAMEFSAVFNLVEAGLWCVIGLIVLGIAAKNRAGSLLWLGLAFLAFGASDLVEVRTGAWWRPWWLFVWKAACVGAFGVFAWKHYRKGESADGFPLSSSQSRPTSGTIMPQNLIKKAVVLAAGKGTRMGDLTEDLPKPMVEVRGTPILESIVQGLQSNGIEEILLIVGYKKEVIENHFGDGSGHGVKICYETQLTQDGTGRVVELAKDFSGGDPFVLSYGDILVPAETYAPLVDLAGDDAILTVRRAPEEEVAKGGAVFVKDGYVTDLIEKPQPPQPMSEFYNAGIYSFTAQVFDFTANLELSPRGEYELTDAIKAMAQGDLKFRAEELTGDWADVRDPSVLDELNG